MKKEEAINLLSNAKVYVDGKSEEIQKKLFEIGFKWNRYNNGVDHKDMPFLYMSQSLNLSYGSDMLIYKEKPYKEVLADDILSITIDKKYEFKPFDKVLVRDNSDGGNIWNADFFSHMREDCNFPFFTVGACWKQCIPFEGNEHLAGTSDSPDKD